MGIPSKIKLFSKLARKKRPPNGYLQPGLRSCPLPGDNLQRPGNGKGFDKLRQWLGSRKRTRTEGYSRPVARKSLFRKMAITGGVATSLVLLLYVVGGEVAKRQLNTVTFFNVTDIAISGNTMISDERLKKATGIILHRTSLLGFDKLKAQAKLEDLPWIRKAAVKKNWPSTIEVSITENVPAALMLKNEFEGPQLYYIDKKGQPFMKVGPGTDLDYPVVTGVSEVVDEKVRETALSEVMTFLRAVRSNNFHLPSQSVSEIHLEPNGEMVVYLVEYTFPIFFGNGNTRKKYSRLVYVLKDLYKKKKGQELISKVEFIQMKYLDDNVLVAQSGSG